MTIPHLTQTHTESRPDSAFLLSTDGRDPLTFEGLAGLAGDFASLLRDLGISRFDRIVTAIPNGPESASVFLAAASAAACAPLNPRYPREQFDFYVDDLDPAAVVLPAGVDSPLREVAWARTIPVIDIRSTEIAGRFEIADIGQIESAVSARIDTDDRSGPADVALLLHTSGTTGRPKLVPIPHSNLLTSARNIASRLALTPNDCALNIMPLFHIHGLVGVLLSSLAAGSKVICSPGLDPPAFPDWLIRLRPTWYSGVPTMHGAILSQLGERWDADACRLRFVRSSSASLPTSTLRRLESAFEVPVIEAYGMTEASHQMTTNPLPPGVRKPGSVGLPAGPEVTIVREDGGRAGAGEQGEVVIRGSSVIDSYGGGSSPESFLDGWFRTGDLGYFDEDGYLFLSGRIKEMINRGGEKVAPAAVEDVLLTHPAVDEVAVFGAPHPTLGEDVAAAVVMRSGHEASSGELRSFALDRLSDAQVPGQVVQVDVIPKGPTGKVQRSQLHRQLAEDMRSGYTPPEGRIAEMLVRIWKEALTDVEPGACDNFFALGGDSLSAAGVAARVSHVFGIDFDIRSLFVDPTLEGMASRIENALLSKIDS